ncbi:DNA internalization-related competence protein ComEC/Rec2 [Shewanella halifaxensis]|uniref:DNA internalization-related competence protein ComEC/Rec2 n=1 Tax=Shewanella halifaxensis TaxID=271098 RepID=UPI000D59760B|nr:DNA internalization-related competence protein ComEC/Rec2 [Shewanella halifaxensis]
MNRFMCGYCITIVSTMFWPSLVSLYILPFVIVVVITACRRFPFIAGSLLAIGWSSVFYSLLMSWNINEPGKTLKIEGEIVSLVSSNRDWISADLVLLGANSSHMPAAKLRLFWKQPPLVSVGQRWQLTIKPKPITSILNQGGFNQQRYFLAQHIVAKGTVISGQLIANSPSYRSRLIAKLKPVLESYASGDLLLALIAGDKSLISDSRWQQLRVCGAGHLFAISGLHLSVVSAWLLLLARTALYRVLPVNSRRNWAICLLISAVGAVCYAYLAGFSVSTQRALIMLLGFILFSVLSRHSSSWERLLYALFIILLLDPFCILSASFWLSFTALVIILLTLSRFAKLNTVLSTSPNQIQQSTAESTNGNKRLRDKVYNGIKMFWALQWRLIVALGVIQAIFFAGTSVVSVVVNMLLVPWFSFILIPLSLFSLICFMFFNLFGLSATSVFDLAALLMEPVLWVLSITGDFRYSWLLLSDDLIAAAIIACIGCFLLINSRSTQWRLALSVMLLPLLLHIGMTLFSPQLNKRWQVHVLDVGQGLSVVIEQNKRAIVYDTGARYGQDFSYAARVLEPFLISKGIRQLDFLILSHSDNDHAGGANYIVDRYPDVKVIADFHFQRTNSSLDRQSTPATRHLINDCRPKQIKWQSLSLDFIAPKEPSKGNNGSCVLRVSSAEHSLLLTGDIEKPVEQALVATIQPKWLQSSILIAPHHGSNTSSSAEFIDAVMPQVTVFAAGFNNRYGFPREEVVERYRQREIEMVTTGIDGQVSVLFNQRTMKLNTYRTDFAPFWYNRVFRFGQMQNPE